VGDFGGVGLVDVGAGAGWYDLYLLVVLICVIGWMLGVVLVVWLWVVVVLICVCDNSLVVGWLCPRHPVTGGLCFRTIPCWMCAVFAMKQTVKSAWLLRPSQAPATRAIAAALRGIVLTASGFTGGVLVGYVMHLLLTAVVPSEV
jgi:hypothetical protein